MTELEILDCLTTRVFGRKLVCLEAVDSTNVYGRSLIAGNFDHGSVVLAEEQTSGKGRNGRNWHAEAGKNLTFSVLLKPGNRRNNISMLPICAGLSVATAIEELTPLRPVCKWPNDILTGGRKLCGILSESVFFGQTMRGVVVGIGLNVNQERFPEPLRHTATSLAIECNRAFDRVGILTKILQSLEDRFGDLELGNAQSIVRDWSRRSEMFGKEITIDQQGKRLRGTALAIDGDGSLILNIDGVQTNVYAGDITIQENT